MTTIAARSIQPGDYVHNVGRVLKVRQYGTEHASTGSQPDPQRRKFLTTLDMARTIQKEEDNAYVHENDGSIAVEFSHTTISYRPEQQVEVFPAQQRQAA